MPLQGRYPKTGDQHETDSDADRCLRWQSPQSWRLNGLSGTDDYGFDYQVQVATNQQMMDIFRVQLKGTRSPNISSDGQFISMQIKASTFRYYHNSTVEPILLVVCDLSPDTGGANDGRLYYVWIRDELNRIDIEKISDSQTYVTLRVPTQNRLTRETDLIDDIRYQNALSRAGQALDYSVQRANPEAQPPERVAIVERLSSGISVRSTAFVDALAAPASEHWITPAPGTLAWHLHQARDDLRFGRLDRASTELDTVKSMLANAVPLEIGEYYCLLGKLMGATGAYQKSSDAFRCAHEKTGCAKYLASWVESELIRGDREGAPADLEGVLQALGGDEVEILCARVRVLAAQGNFDEATSVAERLDGANKHLSKAMVYAQWQRHQEALGECDMGLSLANLPENTRRVFLVFKADAKFQLAHAAMAGTSGPTGSSENQSDNFRNLINDAWDSISLAVDNLRTAGWDPNIDYIAEAWAASASFLGYQQEVFSALSDAARARPHLENVQVALELIATELGEYRSALAANELIPASQHRDLRRTLLLHEAKKHRECVTWFKRHIDSFDKNTELFGSALLVATLSAAKVAEPQLVNEWTTVLDRVPSLREHKALLEYHLAVDQNILCKELALDTLISRFHELDQPFRIAVVLLRYLNPLNMDQALLCIKAATRIKKDMLLPPEMAMQYGLALTTTKDWAGLLHLCRNGALRPDATSNMTGFEALALDRLGNTSEARLLLEANLSKGILDSLAMNTYVTIMARCGYLNEAMAVAEQILEDATSIPQRIECTRLLFNLIQASDVTSPRLLALALQMGRLVDPKSELQEGLYLSMFLTATLAHSNQPRHEEREEFNKRAEAFFSNFPNSKIIRSAKVNDDDSSEEQMAKIKEVAGLTSEREAFQRRHENQLQSGRTAAPFAWRPRLILPSICDVVHLWEIAKISKKDDKKHHLTMLADLKWQPYDPTLLKSRVPLLDWTSLLVLFDLGLIDHVIRFFGKIAITKSTLETLADLTNPFGGSPVRGKCIAMQNSLKQHLPFIIQPSVSGLSDDSEQRNDPLRESVQEVLELVRNQSDTYRLYSDDYFFRVFCVDGAAVSGICTLDVLAALEEAGILTRNEVAKKISTLCSWRVGLVVRLQELVSLLPPSLSHAKTVKHGIEMLDAEPDINIVVSAVWDFRAKFEKALAHAAEILRQFCNEATLPNVSIAALMGQWFVKVGLKNDAPSDPLEMLTLLIVIAAARETLESHTAQNLLSVYKSLVEFHHGDRMDETKEREAIRRLGAKCAQLHKKSSENAEHIFNGLRQGFTEGTSDEAAFSSGYSGALLSMSLVRR